MMFQKPHRAALASLLLLTLLMSVISQETLASDNSTAIQVSKESKNLSLTLKSGISALEANSGSVNGADGGVLLEYALTNKWNLGVGVSAGLNANGFATLFTEFESRLSYALTGEFFQNREVTKLDGYEVRKSTEYSNPAWVVFGSMKQFFFNGSDQVIPFVAPGAGAYYQFGSAYEHLYHVGASADFGQNGSKTLTSFKVFFGVRFFI